MIIVGRDRLADLFGVHPKTITDWVAQGMPVHKRGGPHVPAEYDSGACIAWSLQRAAEKASRPESPMDRRYRLEADMLEMELAEKRARLLPADAVQPLWDAAVAAAREQLHVERQRLVELLAGVTGRPAIEALIGQVHEAYLRRLGEWGPPEQAHAEAPK